jgi:hypothetical protein
MQFSLRDLDGNLISKKSLIQMKTDTNDNILAFRCLHKVDILSILEVIYGCVDVHVLLRHLLAF